MCHRLYLQRPGFVVLETITVTMYNQHSWSHFMESCQQQPAPDTTTALLALFTVVISYKVHLWCNASYRADTVWMARTIPLQLP